MGNKWEVKLGQGWEERKRMQFETVLFNTMWQKFQSDFLNYYYYH